MRIAPVLFALALFAAPSALAQESSGKEYSSQDLVEIHNMRCSSLRSGKAARLKADIHRTEAAHARGVQQLVAEQNLTQAEAEAGQAFEESGRLRRQLSKMVDSYVSARRVAWYKQVDQSRKIKLEDQIKFALDLLEDGCGK